MISAELPRHIASYGLRLTASSVLHFFHYLLNAANKSQQDSKALQTILRFYLISENILYLTAESENTNGSSP